MEMDQRFPESVIGLKVRVKTNFDEQIEGGIFTYDSTTNCVTLIQPGSNAHSNLKKSYRVLKTSFIKEMVYLGRPEESLADFEDLAPPPINKEKIRAKEEQVLRQLQEEANRIGEGVTREAQEIFNALAKTLPCRWRREAIIVFDDVVISPPYTGDKCTGRDPVTLDRVKLVLEGERKRLMKVST